MTIYSNIYLENGSNEIKYISYVYSACVPEHGDLIIIDSERYIVKRKIFRLNSSNHNSGIDIVVSKNIGKELVITDE